MSIATTQLTHPLYKNDRNDSFKEVPATLKANRLCSIWIA